MSKDSGIEKNQINKYLEYLEAAFLIKVVHKIKANAKHFKRAVIFKIYLTNPSLRTALFSPISPTDDEAGNLVETAIFAQWFHRHNQTLYYASWKDGRKTGEVDMVGLGKKDLAPKWAIEIKWTNRYFEKPNELRSLLDFCIKNNLSSALVTSIDKQGSHNRNSIEINYFPAAVYAYIVGANTIVPQRVY